MRYIEEVISIEVASGQTKNTIEISTNSDGTIVEGVVAYHSGLAANTDIINAQINVGGQEVSPNQHIENYRSREAAYDKGYKPVKNFESGKKVRIEVSSDTAFTSDFKAQFVLIKKLEENNC